MTGSSPRDLPLHTAAMDQAISMGLYVYIYLTPCKTQALRTYMYSCSIEGTPILVHVIIKINLKSRGAQIFNLESLKLFGS